MMPPHRSIIHSTAACSARFARTEAPIGAGSEAPYVTREWPRFTCTFYHRAICVITCFSCVGVDLHGFCPCTQEQFECARLLTLEDAIRRHVTLILSSSSSRRNGRSLKAEYLEAQRKNPRHSLLNEKHFSSVQVTVLCRAAGKDTPSFPKAFLAIGGRQTSKFEARVERKY